MKLAALAISLLTMSACVGATPLHSSLDLLSATAVQPHASSTNAAFLIDLFAASLERSAHDSAPVTNRELISDSAAQELIAIDAHGKLAPPSITEAAVQVQSSPAPALRGLIKAPEPPVFLTFASGFAGIGIFRLRLHPSQRRAKRLRKRVQTRIRMMA